MTELLSLHISAITAYSGTDSSTRDLYWVLGASDTEQKPREFAAYPTC